MLHKNRVHHSTTHSRVFSLSEAVRAPISTLILLGLALRHATTPALPPTSFFRASRLARRTPAAPTRRTRVHTPARARRRTPSPNRRVVHGVFCVWYRLVPSHEIFTQQTARHQLSQLRPTAPTAPTAPYGPNGTIWPQKLRFSADRHPSLECYQTQKTP